MIKMTKEEAIERFRHDIAMSKLDLKLNKRNMSVERETMIVNSIARNEVAIEALKQESKKATIDAINFISEMSQKVAETEEEFIFETIVPWCEEIT